MQMPQNPSKTVNNHSNRLINKQTQNTDTEKMNYQAVLQRNIQQLAVSFSFSFISFSY